MPIANREEFRPMVEPMKGKYPREPNSGLLRLSDGMIGHQLDSSHVQFVQVQDATMKIILWHLWKHGRVIKRTGHKTVRRTKSCDLSAVFFNLPWHISKSPSTVSGFAIRAGRMLWPIHFELIGISMGKISRWWFSRISYATCSIRNRLAHISMDSDNFTPMPSRVSAVPLRFLWVFISEWYNPFLSSMRNKSAKKCLDIFHSGSKAGFVSLDKPDISRLTESKINRVRQKSSHISHLLFTPYPPGFSTMVDKYPVSPRHTFEWVNAHARIGISPSAPIKL